MNVCVYCSSNLPENPAFSRAATELGLALTKRGLGLVYGGTCIGLMGVLASTVMDNGGFVCGVIPKTLQSREISRFDISEVHVVTGLQERKAMMAEKAQAFIALPGGIGTMDELFECLSWSTLGVHRKPVGLLNIEGYYDKLLDFLDSASSQGFIPRHQLNSLQVATTPDALLNLFENYEPPALPQWLLDCENSWK